MKKIFILILLFSFHLSAQEIDGYIHLKGNRTIKYDCSKIIALLDKSNFLSIGGETTIDLITEQTFTDTINPIVKIEGYYVQFEEKHNGDVDMIDAELEVIEYNLITKDKKIKSKNKDDKYYLKPKKLKEKVKLKNDKIKKIKDKDKPLNWFQNLLLKIKRFL